MTNSTLLSQHLYNIVKGFVGKQIQNKDDRDDVVQTVFLKLHEKIATIHDEQKAHAWIFKTAQNAIYDYYRHIPKKTSTAIEIIENTDFSEKENTLQTMNNCLNPFINKLPPHYKQAILLSEMEGLKLQTIANQLNISLSAVKSRVQRAKAMIREMYIDCCAFTIDAHGRLKGEHKDPENCTKCKPE